MSFIFNTTLAEVGSTLVEVATTSAIVQQVVVAVVVGGILIKVRSVFAASAARSKFEALVKNQKAGEVYIYAYPRLVDGIPHPGFNVTKIEAFCRINKVPYHMVMGPEYGRFSPTETLPFICIDGKLVGESQFCVDAIAKRFKLPEAHLSAQEQSTSVLVRKTLDLSLTQHINRTTLVDNAPVLQEFFGATFAPALGVPSFLVPFGFGQYRKQTIKKLNTSGLGWLNTERYLLELTRDVQAIAFLIEESQRKGNKYLGGDTPNSADCFLYGVLVALKPLKGITVNTAGVDAFTTNPALVKFAADFEAEVYPDLKTIAPCGATTQSFA